MIEAKVGFIGGGAMAEAMLRGILASGELTPQQVMVSDPEPKRREYLTSELQVRTVMDNIQVVQFAEIIILAVKPYLVGPVLAEFKEKLQASQILVSIAAGVPIAAIAGETGEIPLARVMPNTPCQVGAGVFGLVFGTTVDAAQQAKVIKLLETCGAVYVVAENLMDKLTGLSGSGPAYVYVIIEALADAGVRNGLPRQLATALAAQTVLGAAKMVADTGEHPGILKDKVCSPGGTTIEGVYAMEKGGVRAAMIEAVSASSEKAARLAGK